MELVHTGTATGGTTSTLEDTLLTESAGRYTGGTLWVLTGDNAGLCCPVIAHGNGSLMFTAVTDAIAAGDKYALSSPQFPKWLLDQAVDTALEGIDVIASSTETIVAGVLTLTLGIQNVRRVYINGKENFHWDEELGVITFDNTGLSGDAVVKYLVKANTTVDIDGELQTLVDPDHVAWSAVVFLWRNLIERIHKDNPSAIDLLNEAKINEAAAKSKCATFPAVNLSRSPRYSKWTK
jgi:hypothetical protein